MAHVIIETCRLIGRRLSHDDLDILYAVYSNAEVVRWVGDGQPLDRETCARWVEVTHNNYMLHGYGMFALVHRETGETIGFCGLVHPGGQPEVEIKYALLPAFWGQGFATEAVRTLLTYGAQTFQMSSIIATVYPENLASQRVLLKARMKVVKDRQNDNGTTTRVFVWQPEYLTTRGD